MANFYDEKIAHYQGMKELEEKALDMINTRIMELDHDPTEQEIADIQDEVWTSLESK